VKQELLTDIQSLTQINIKLLNKLVAVAELVICDSINELDMMDDQILDLDIGIGTVSLLVSGNTIQYAFYPSTNLENNLIKTLEKKTNPLILSAENNLETKILNTYKELV
jgi:hypothetical protein